jgi:glucose-1-phosphate adenylyltransferase
MDWYQGTADAVRQNIRYVHEDGCKEVLILSGDQLYRMDFRKMIESHRESGADATLAVLPVAEELTPGLGLVRVDDHGRVLGFVEKPKQKEQLGPIRMPAEWMEQRGIESKGREYLASMGIYVFKKDSLIRVLNAPPLATDFGKEVFPRSLGTHHVHTFLFDGYWEDVGTIGAYHEASLALTGRVPPFDFHSPGGVIYTRMRYLPASRVNDAHLEECLVSDGCFVDGGTQIRRCVLGVRTRIGQNCKLTNSVIIGADRFETDEERASNRTRGIPDLGVGDGTVIEKAILDKDARIGKNVKILNKNKAENEDGQNYVIREGVVVIPKGAVVLDGAVI